MAIMEIGRVCVKKAGKDAGKKCVVTEVVDDIYVVVAGPDMKQKKCNMVHLEPTDKTIKVGKTIKPEELKELLK